MKLMKHIMIALVLCAIPAMAFGQTVSCDNCTHQLSVYMGSGGFVATHDDDMDAEKVTWVASCNGITRNGELEPDKDGMVAALLTDDLACHAEGGGSFRLGPITDGGWFWINDEKSSAVGNLVALDLFDDKGMSVNGTVDITSAGDGVTMMDGKGAVYLKEAASGRVGILPNILPEPMMEEEADPKCGFSGAGTPASPFKLANMNCEMGDGKAMLLATTYNSITGGSQRIMDKGSVIRPAGNGSVPVTIDVWGNGSGHFRTDATGASANNGIGWLLGQPAATATAPGRTAARLTGVTWAATVGTGGPSSSHNLVEGAAAGVTLDASTTANVAALTIQDDDEYCSKTANHTAVVTVSAMMTAVDNTGRAQITPAIATVGTSGQKAAGRVATLSFNVVCPAASANLGTDLVPENPFPTTE